MARTFSDGTEGQPGAAPESTLASGIAIGAVSCAVQAGHGTRFPAAGDFSIRFEDATDPTHFENVTASVRSTDTITHGPTTYAWDAGDKVMHAITKADLDAFAETADLASYQALLVSEGFRAYRSTAQSLSSGTITTIVFDTEVFDEGADYNNATGEWIVPATGWYDVGGYVMYAGVSDGIEVSLYIYVNNTPHSILGLGYSAAASSYPDAGGCIPMRLTAADVVTLRGKIGEAKNVEPGTAFSYFTAKRRY